MNAPPKNKPPNIPFATLKSNKQENEGSCSLWQINYSKKPAISIIWFSNGIDARETASRKLQIQFPKTFTTTNTVV